MNYRSISDMAKLIRNNLALISDDIDLVVGVPRSGLIAAGIIALHKNLKITGLNSFLSNDVVVSGHTRTTSYPTLTYAHDAKHVLLVDDSSASGNSMRGALESVYKSGYKGAITTCAIYLAPDSPKVDVYFELLPHIRIFEWNLMHREFLHKCCVDFDGILCVDPTDNQNDGGEKYLDFLDSATPLLIPTYPIGRVVTSRLEKYRAKTETWLQRHKVDYHKLDMLDLPDERTRRKLRIHAKFKAGIYARDPNMKLFIESNREQAIEIAHLSGKPALCVSTQELFQPGITIPYLTQTSRRWRRKGITFIKNVFRKNEI